MNIYHLIFNWNPPKNRATCPRRFVGFVSMSHSLNPDPTIPYTHALWRVIAQDMGRMPMPRQMIARHCACEGRETSWHQ